ncbi:hypothetical protein MRB53_039739 [Persea americana]|nr:hypothetical protein MRB53_039739 [Persea americana]
MTIPLAESDILESRPQSINDDNEWPEFDLNSCCIYDEDNKLTSLLLADGPTVKQRDVLPARIEITNVQQFAWGQYDDREIAIWAAGKAGWFKIRPDRQYREVYKDMIEAIAVLYFLADLYRDKRGKKAIAAVTFSEVLDTASQLAQGQGSC